MSSVEKMNEEIRNKIAAKRSEDPEADVPEKVQTTNTGVLGTVLSKPGTEMVTLDASTFQLMECEAAAEDVKKRRFCLVQKQTPAQYVNQFVNSKGERVHIVTRDLYHILRVVFANAAKQIATLDKDLKTTQQERDMYKLTIDALRKNGLID